MKEIRVSAAERALTDKELETYLRCLDVLRASLQDYKYQALVKEMIASNSIYLPTKTGHLVPSSLVFEKYAMMFPLASPWVW